MKKRRRALRFFADCACGRRYTKKQWATLEYVGVWHLPQNDVFEREQNLEMRNCVCKSTLAVDRGPGFAKATYRVPRPLRDVSERYVRVVRVPQRVVRLLKKRGLLSQKRR